MRVYRYGVKLSQSLPPEAEQQILLAHRLWNDLVAIHRSYAEQKDRAWREASAELDALLQERERLEAEIAELRTQIKGARQQSRSRVPPDRSIKERIAQSRARLADLKPRIAAARQTALLSAKPTLHTLQEEEERAYKRIRQQYAATGLYWGTYLAVFQGFELAVQQERAHKGQVRFHPWDGSGTLTVQIQHPEGTKPFTWHDALSASPSHRFSVCLPSTTETIVAKNGRTVTRKRCAQVRMQVRAERAKGPDGWVDLEPAWIDLPVYVHRQPAPDARIVRVQLVRERVAGRYAYNLCVTTDETGAIPRDGLACAVDVGWRSLDDGRIRVAYWVGEDGEEGQITVPERTIARTNHASHLRSIRDQAFAMARDTLASWLEQASDLPEFLRVARDGAPAMTAPDGTVIARQKKGIRAWRSPQRLASLYWTWAKWRQQNPDAPERWPHIDEQMTALDRWRTQDRHLWEIEAHSRLKAAAEREQAYRIAAKHLATRYAYIVAEDMALPSLLRKPSPEEGPMSEGHHLRHVAGLAAPGQVWSALRTACGRWGSMFRREEAAYTTRVHAACGALVTADYSASVMVYCPSCTQWYDQDRNACINLLHRLHAARASGALAPSAPEAKGARGGRWARRKAAARGGEREPTAEPDASKG